MFPFSNSNFNLNNNNVNNSFNLYSDTLKFNAQQMGKNFNKNMFTSNKFNDNNNSSFHHKNFNKFGANMIKVGQQVDCDEKMINCKIMSGFDPKEWASLQANCEKGDQNACDTMSHKYDGEQGAFMKYQQCLQGIGSCQNNQNFQQEYQQLSESPSVLSGMLPLVGGLIAGGLMGAMMQRAFSNRQQQFATQGMSTPYNQPGYHPPQNMQQAQAQAVQQRPMGQPGAAQQQGGFSRQPRAGNTTGAGYGPQSNSPVQQSKPSGTAANPSRTLGNTTVADSRYQVQKPGATTTPQSQSKPTQQAATKPSAPAQKKPVPSTSRSQSRSASRGRRR